MRERLDYAEEEPIIYRVTWAGLMEYRRYDPGVGGISSLPVREAWRAWVIPAWLGIMGGLALLVWWAS